MSEQTIRVRAQADVQAIVDYSRKVRDATAAVREFQDVVVWSPDTFGRDAKTHHAAQTTSSPGLGAHLRYQQRLDADRGRNEENRAAGVVQANADRAKAHTKERDRSQIGAAFGQANRMGGSFVSRAASTALGVGLGSSITGFLLQSGHKYMELSKIIAQLDARFASAAGSVTNYGSALGYTIAQTGQFMEILGGQTNTVGRGEAQEFLGYGRTFGIDPSTTMRSMGTARKLIGALRRAPARTAYMEEMSGLAARLGMSEGRHGEFMEQRTGLVSDMFASTGHVDRQGLRVAQALPGLVFGTLNGSDDERGRGQAATGFLHRLQGTMTGGGPMKSYMMRVMGFGRKGGPSYIDMRKRLEEGIYNPDNIGDLFGEFQAAGYSNTQMFMGLESVSGGQLKAHELEALVQNLGSAEGLAAYKAEVGAGGDRSAAAALQARKNRGEQSAYKRGGFVATGAATVSRGEGYGLTSEEMMMGVGRTVSTVMSGLQKSFQNLAEGMGLLVNIDWQKSTEDIAESLVELTATFKEASGAIKTVGGIQNAMDTVLGDGLSGKVHMGTATPAERARWEANEQAKEAKRDLIIQRYGGGTGL